MQRAQITYKKDFKVRIPTLFSADIIYEMLGNDSDKFIDFFEEYNEVKEARAKRRVENNQKTSIRNTEAIKRAFKKNSKYYGKVVDTITINRDKDENEL